MCRDGLRDDQWDRIKHLLAGQQGWVGVTAADNRLFVEAVLHRYRAGLPWRDLPERFGDGVKVHRRFSRWAKFDFGHLGPDHAAWQRVYAMPWRRRIGSFRLFDLVDDMEKP